MDMSFLHPLMPVLILALGSLFLLLLGAYARSALATAVAAGILYAGTACWLRFFPATGSLFGLEDGTLMLVSPFTNIASLILVKLGILCLPLLACAFSKRDHKPELYVLLTLSLTGMLVLMGATHMLSLYVGVELMSFPLYILAAYARDDAKSSEAGLKYFVLGSLASGLMLFGISLLFASLGSLSFIGIGRAIALSGGAAQPLAMAGMALTLLGTLFKLSVVPLHMWTPDVYEGSPSPVTAIMGALPKIAGCVLLIRLLAQPFLPFIALWQPALMWLTIATMIAGATLAIIQTSLKRLMAFSTVANVGFIMVGVVAATPLAHSGVLSYLTIYGFTFIGIFAVFIAMGDAHDVKDLSGLAARSPLLAASFAVFMFSLAGIPPLAGFMAKFMVFGAAVQAGFSALALVGVLASVIAAFYALWLVKTVYFDAPLTPEPIKTAPALAVTIGIIAAATVLLGLFPSFLTSYTLAGAAAIF